MKGCLGFWWLLLSCLIVFWTPGYARSTCGPNKPIIPAPILFNKERIILTQIYRRQHYGIPNQAITIVPQLIVLHWTGLPTLNESFAWFYPPRLHSRPDLSGYGQLNVSAHFLVDRNGAIYQLMPANWMARHVIGLDNSAIGIENVGGVNGVADLTQQQADANAYLICVLVHQFPSIRWVIGHYAYLRFRNTPLWLERDPNYVTQKSDPGQNFMIQVKARLEKRG